MPVALSLKGCFSLVARPCRLGSSSSTLRAHTPSGLLQVKTQQDRQPRPQPWLPCMSSVALPAATRLPEDAGIRLRLLSIPFPSRPPTASDRISLSLSRNLEMMSGWCGRHIAGAAVSPRFKGTQGRVGKQKTSSNPAVQVRAERDEIVGMLEQSYSSLSLTTHIHTTGHDANPMPYSRTSEPEALPSKSMRCDLGATVSAVPS